MAKLDDSIVSHISITESNHENEGQNDEAREVKMQELLSGIEAREKLLQTKQRQLQTQNETLSKNLEDRLDRIKGEEVRVAQRISELDKVEKNINSRTAQVVQTEKVV